MSDPMSNREIEDVLSSIRRLVAREAARPAPERPAPDRLVLTEAQRIAVNDSHPPGAGSNAHGANQPDATDTPSGKAPGHSPMPAARAEASAGNQERVTLSAAPGDVSHTSRGAEASITPEAPITPGAQRDTGPDHAAAPEAEATDPGADAVRESWQVPSSQRMAGGDAMHPRQAINDASPGLQGGSSDESEVQQDASWPAVAGDAQAPFAAGSDTAEDGDAAGIDDAEEVDDGLVDGVDDSPGDSPDPTETLIDEEMLRALVAQLVREELHGQLGERITMQVRKLVRAEVARALDERQYL